MRHSSWASENRARFLRQGLNLAGFHQKPFDAAIKAIERIRLFFDRSVGGGVQAADHITTTVGPGISASSRYFSHKNDVDSKDIVAFDAEVDPKGYLAAIGSSTFLHTKDNVVSYVQYETDSLTGMGTYVTCKCGLGDEADPHTGTKHVLQRLLKPATS